MLYLNKQTVQLPKTLSFTGILHMQQFQSHPPCTVLHEQHQQQDPTGALYLPPMACLVGKAGHIASGRDSSETPEGLYLYSGSCFE